MAVAPTGNIFKALSFDNVSSRTYGVYITGEAVYNAPGRDVEMVEIPGRNGSFALDKGRFQNIEVTYPAGIFADNETDFAEAISDFRNFLCSRRGYVRLTDEYNPNEYRMAIYKSGLEVSPAQLKAGEFTITFDCKPQRWLTSGETAATVANNGTLTNPTLFESSPLLAVEGYGTIGFNGYEIEIENVELGQIQVSNGFTFSSGFTKTFTINTTNLNASDNIYPADNNTVIIAALGSNAYGTFTFNGVTSSTNVISAYGSIINQNKLNLYIAPDFGTGFAYGTSSTITSSAVYSYKYGTSADTAETVSVSFAYDGDDTITITTTRTGTLPTNVFRGTTYDSVMTALNADSTKSLLGHPTYIDCDLGEAYRIDGNTITSLNQHIDLGSDLPKLASGTNTFTKSNTVTQLKVTPRWWKV